MIVIDAIENGIKQPGNMKDTFEYITDNIKVVVNKIGAVITVYPQYEDLWNLMNMNY